MQDKKDNEMLKHLKLPEIKMSKGKMRRTLVDDTGLTYEIEEEIELPEIIKQEETDNGIIQ